MNITVLCKVVDNFGDIGVTWRLARQLKKENPSVCINLVADNLDSFNKICSKINPVEHFQVVDGVCVYDWNAYEFCKTEFSKNDGEKLAVILECFQCGRPDWMEKILFDEKLERTVQIIMIDYLTAEKYAEDFHCLMSLTRSAKVQKVNFMPGFTEKTGGLIIDDDWKESFERNKKGDVLVFTYERNWKPLLKALPCSFLFINENSEAACERKILLAQGRGKESFALAASECGASGLVKELPYLNQEEWDLMLKKCSVLFIRGEESMSRACLSGIPFVWHAYPQSDEYQMVKVNALLERMKIHFEPNDFEIVRNVWLDFNLPEMEVSEEKMQADILLFLNASERICRGFQDFSISLRKIGSLTVHLMTFINQKCIINE